MKRIKPEEALKQILNPTFTRIRPNHRTQNVSTRWLGHLVMESLCSYRENPTTYGQESRSFDAVMKKFVDENIGHRPRSKRYTNLGRLLAAYKRPNGPRQSLARKRVGTHAADKYFARKGRAIFRNSVADMQAQTIGRGKVIPDAVFLPAGNSILQGNHRHIEADLQSVVCKNRSESSDDEIYMLTGAVLYDSTGKWDSHTDYMRDETEDIDAPPAVDVEFPDHLNPLFEWNIVKPPAGSEDRPVSAIATVTLMERDQSPREQIVKAFQAAYATGKMLANLLAGTAGGPVGVAIAIVNILILLLLALDADDILGTAEFRFDNVLSGDAPADFEVADEVSGSQNGNGYRYILKARYRSQDFDAPTSYHCEIKGPNHLSIPAPGETTKGRYKMRVSSISGVQTQVEDIAWNVSPSGGTRVVNQGLRDTWIEFDRTGSFVLSVAARIQGTGEQVTDTHRVGIDLGGGIPH